MTGDVAIALLAGGRATRLAHKLERPVAGRTMLATTYERASETGWPVYVVGSAPFVPAIPEGARTIADATPGEGPLQALVAACQALSQRDVVALAADEPRVDARLLYALAAARTQGYEAIVPQHAGGIEPLVALYDRAAVLREAPAAVHDGASMHALLERLRVRYVAAPSSAFANVNTAADYERLQREFA